MRLTRVFVDARLGEGNRLTLPTAQSQHLTRVLRVRSGQSVTLFNGDGRDYASRIAKVGRGGVVVEIGTPGNEESPAPLRLHIGLGISKGERMDFALQKAVELGVCQITPLFTDRSVVRLEGARLAQRAQHWRGVVIAASEQSGRRRLTDLASPARLYDWLERGHICPLLLDHRGAIPLTGIPAPDRGLTLLVGPEGGLAASERVRAQQAGFTAVRLGPRILRTETAPLAALAVVQALWGDLGR
ncbi:MAG: 16S rRNA (uracil(1498)-N(3))-methyltransferase [Chromatiaceae bacterium]